MVENSDQRRFGSGRWAILCVELTNSVVSSANIESHARIVLQNSFSVPLIRISGEIMETLAKTGTDVFRPARRCEKANYLKLQPSRKNFDDIETALMKTIQRIEDSVTVKKILQVCLPVSLRWIRSHTAGGPPT